MINLLELKSIRSKLVSALLASCLPLTTYSQSSCTCKAVGPHENTRPGANELIETVERKPRKSVFGQVSDEVGQPLKNVLVEVFALPPRKEVKEEKRRIKACTTDEKGHFCFRKIPTGRYEVLFSLDGGWKHTIVSVLVAPNNPKSINRKLDVWLQVGT